MEKRFIVAIILCAVILMVYPQYVRMIAPKQPVGAAEQTAAVGQTAEKTATATEEAIPQEKLQLAEIVKKEKNYTLANEYVTVEFSNVGASIEMIALNAYFTKDGARNIQLLHKEDGVRSFVLQSPRADADTSMRIFDVTKQSPTEIQFTATLPDRVVVKTFSLRADASVVDMTVTVTNNAQSAISATYELAADLRIDLANAYEKRFAQFAVFHKDKITSVLYDKVKSKGALVDDQNAWIALRRQYFALFVKPEYTMTHARALVENDSIIRGFVKTPERELAPGEAVTDTYTVYMGPTKYNDMKKLGLGFEKILSGGFWGFFRLMLLIAMNYCYVVFKNYGIAIILLTVAIKILFAPLSHQSFSSMKKMQELQPHMKALQEQFKNDPQRLNKEVMEMYRKHKVNPLGGCLPLLLQMPIFIALYQVLSEAVELRRAHFVWWMKDLSEPDRLINLPFTIPLVNIDAINVLPILMLLSMVWQQKLTASATPQSKEQQTMMMLMPVIFGFIFYNLPSGLVLYWFVNNILTIGHQLFHHKTTPAAITQ